MRSNSWIACSSNPSAAAAVPNSAYMSSVFPRKRVGLTKRTIFTEHFTFACCSATRWASGSWICDGTVSQSTEDTFQMCVSGHRRIVEVDEYGTHEKKLDILRIRYRWQKKRASHLHACVHAAVSHCGKVGAPVRCQNRLEHRE